MPAIKKNDAQEKALDEIKEALATIQTLNAILVTGWKGPIIISYDTGESGRGKFVKLTIDPEKNVKDHAAIVKLAQKQKSKLVQEIRNRSQKYAIGLDSSDRAIMGPADAAVAKARGAKAEAGDEEMDMEGEEGLPVEEPAEGLPAEPDVEESAFGHGSDEDDPEAYA